MNLNFLNHGITNIHAAAFLLGAAGLLSRILGFLRDRMLASHFGAGRELDIYYAAFQIPDFMSVIFFLGAGSAAILPIFQEYLIRDRRSAHRLISEISTVFLWGVIFVSLIIFSLAPFLMRFVAPGFTEDERMLTVVLTRLMLIAPILLGFSSIFSAVVQSFQRFLSYALAPVFYNIGIIIGILIFVPIFGIMGLGFGVVLGAFLHFGIQLWSVFKLGFMPRIYTYLWDKSKIKGVMRVAAISLPRALAIALSHITLLLLIAIGSTLEEGSIAIFQLAQNLYFLPVGVFGISYATAIFPRMSRAFIVKDADEFFREFFVGLRTILFWIAPSAVLFIVLRAHIVRVVLGAGAFSWEDTRLTAASLAIFAITMGAGGLISLFLRGFYALEDTWRPFFINIGASALSILSAIFFVDFFASSSGLADLIRSIFRVQDLGHVEVLGLALGFALGLLVNVILLYTSLIRLAARSFGRRVRKGGLISGFPIFEVGKIAAGAILSGIAAYGVRLSFSESLPLITFFQVLLQGFLAGFAGIAVYFGTLFIMRNQDVFALWVSFERRFIKIGVLPKTWDGEADIRQHYE